MERKLLVIDDNPDILAAVKILFKGKVDEVFVSTSPDAIPELLRKHRPQVVLLDMNFRATVNSGNEGLFWLRETKRLSPQTEVVLFTAYADINLAVEGMKSGAADFVVKPFDNKTLVETIRDVFGKNTGRRTLPASAMLWGKTPAMTRLHEIVQRIAPTNANILIIGENGTGKDLLAREIHSLSSRSAGPLEIIDMGAVVETLFESELYGHAKGAFTDARSDRAGKFETADGGTLFLDEIGNLPYHLQARLLTSLQQRRVTRVGATASRPIDVRLICATNKNLDKMVADGTFRQDLFYRINTLTIEIPPLRERSEDIPELTYHFIEKYAKLYGRHSPGITPQALKRLQSMQWPGNIRQLEHTVERALLLGDSRMLGADDFESGMPQTDSVHVTAGTLEDMERNAIAAAVRQCGGNMTEVARRLGITRQTLYNKLRRYGI